MSKWQGAASIGVIGGADGPTTIYIENREKWKQIARQVLLVAVACITVWKLARRIYKKK